MEGGFAAISLYKNKVTNCSSTSNEMRAMSTSSKIENEKIIKTVYMGGFYGYSYSSFLQFSLSKNNNFYCVGSHQSYTGAFNGYNVFLDVNFLVSSRNIVSLFISNLFFFQFIFYFFILFIF